MFAYTLVVGREIQQIEKDIRDLEVKLWKEKFEKDDNKDVNNKGR